MRALIAFFCVLIGSSAYAADENLPLSNLPLNTLLKIRSTRLELPPRRESVELKAVGLDSDQDGVYDYEDRCPNTPYPTVVWTKERYNSAQNSGAPLPPNSTDWLGCVGNESSRLQSPPQGSSAPEAHCDLLIDKQEGEREILSEDNVIFKVVKVDAPTSAYYDRNLHQLVKFEIVSDGGISFFVNCRGTIGKYYANYDWNVPAPLIKHLNLFFEVQQPIPGRVR